MTDDPPDNPAPQAGDAPSTTRARVLQSREAHDYRLGLSDTERAMMEQSSYNFFHLTGRKMKVPPRLFSDLKSKGVRMKYMEPDGKLEQ